MMQIFFLILTSLFFSMPLYAYELTNKEKKLSVFVLINKSDNGQTLKLYKKGKQVPITWKDGDKTVTKKECKTSTGRGDFEPRLEYDEKNNPYCSETPEGFFRFRELAGKDREAKGRYKGSPMPYASELVGNDIFGEPASGIFMHGTESIRRLGRKASGGCVRLFPKCAMAVQQQIKNLSSRTNITKKAGARIYDQRPPQEKALKKIRCRTSKILFSCAKKDLRKEGYYDRETSPVRISDHYVSGSRGGGKREGREHVLAYLRDKKTGKFKMKDGHKIPIHQWDPKTGKVRIGNHGFPKHAYAIKRRQAKYYIGKDVYAPFIEKCMKQKSVRRQLAKMRKKLSGSLKLLGTHYRDFDPDWQSPEVDQ